MTTTATPPRVPSTRTIKQQSPSRLGELGRALIASAARIMGRKVDRTVNLATAKGGWQAEAWDLYDLVGEERYLADTLANTIGRARLYVGRVSDQDEMGAPVPVEDGDNADVLDLLGSESERSQMLQRFGVNDFIAGEGWLVGMPKQFLTVQEEPDDPMFRLAPEAVAVPDEIDVEDLEWRYMSIEEVTIDGESVQIEWADADAADSNDQIHVTQSQIYLIRVWHSHPRRRKEATSPTKASLPVLRELVGLTMHISAQTDSRLAGAGVLFLMQSAKSRIAGEGEDAEDVDFDTAFMDAMITPIRDRSSAAAVVPLTVPIPDDGTGRAAADYVHFQTFSTPFDEETRELREEAIRRLALGQDAPPEVLLGLGSMNHWGAWLVKEDTITTHVEPPLARFCDALTTQFLRPVLQARGFTEDQRREYVIWYSVKHLIVRPNSTDDAFKAHEVGVITDEALRNATGFTDSDAPEDGGIAEDVAMVLAMVNQTPALAANPGMPELLRQVREVLAGRAAEEPAEPEPTPEPEPVPEPIAEEEPPSDGTLPGTNDDPAPTPAGGPA